MVWRLFCRADSGLFERRLERELVAVLSKVQSGGDVSELELFLMSEFVSN